MDDDYGSKYFTFYFHKGENAVSKASPVAIGNPQTTDEYNKDQEYINNNLFTLVDNDLIFTNASENLELNETPLKVEDYDDDLLIEPISNKISENSSSYANYMHDTRSEGSKEDNQRLESIIPKEKGKNNSKNKRSKNKRGNNQNKNKNKDNNKNRKIVEPKLEEIKKANSYTDDPHVDNDIILKSKDIELNVPLNSKSNQARKGEHDKRHDNRKKEHVAKNIVDVKSSKSEDKRANNPTKHVTSTNPASEGSSMKDPNNHDAKFKSDSKPKTKETIETTNNDWIQTEKKIKQKVTKSKRGQKSDRRQYKASKASEQISKPVNKSKSPIRNDTPFLAKK